MIYPKKILTLLSVLSSWVRERLSQILLKHHISFIN